MIASLPMYDWPEVRGATDAWWNGIARHLNVSIPLSRDDAGPFGNRPFDPRPLCGVQRFQRFGTPRLGLDGLQLHPKLVGESLGVIVPGGLCPVGYTLANRNNDQLHSQYVRLCGTLLFWQALFLPGLLPPRFSLEPGCFWQGLW